MKRRRGLNALGTIRVKSSLDSLGGLARVTGVTCPQCRREPYTPKGDWQKICTSCWVNNKDRETYSKGYAKGYDAGFHAAMDDMEKQLAKHLPYRDLIALTHPDRHPDERKELANRITAAVNDFWA